ncbi:MAG: DUF1016 family protein [Candidatus Altiarchaeota archaeon]|nr:DUF1016 family protein [Candidatus Altiarchaeota archaeon]
MDRKDQRIDETYANIRSILETARTKAYRTINQTMTEAYWNIGKIIVKEEQKGKKRAEYGKKLIKELANRLTNDYGKGFTETNLRYMRQFYLTQPKHHALSDELTWTHHRLLLRVEKPAARSFYQIEAEKNRWSTRELERQINTLLYERIALSKNKETIKALAQRGQEIEKPQDAIKDPYVLEFLGLKEDRDYLEKDLEQALIDKLQQFLLELGKGFSFVERQKRITVDADHYYVDLVFYNYILRCFVLIDLKTGKLTHQDIGQIDFYVRYYEKEIKQENDNPTIGIILCADKNQTMVKYTLLQDSRQIYAPKYQLLLPTEEELRKEIDREKELIQREKNAGRRRRHV